MKHDQETRPEPSRLATRSKWVLISFLAVGAFFLITEHRAHLYGALPYLLILACVAMHMFHGHGGHGNHHANAPGEKLDGNDAPHKHEHRGR